MAEDETSTLTCRISQKLTSFRPWRKMFPLDGVSNYFQESVEVPQ